MIEHVVAVLIGAATGIVSGLFGIGGSSISTPLLRVTLDTAPLIALASPLPVTLPTAISGSLVYQRAGMINWSIARWIILGGLPTMVIGSLLTKWIAADYLMYLVAASVVFVGMQLYRSKPPLALEDGTIPDDPRWMAPPPWELVLVAAAIGLPSGLLANGGGFLLVPAFVLLFGARVRQAAATSLPCVAALAIPGTITHALLGHIDWLLSLELTLGVIPATYIGAQVSIWLRRVRLRKPFGLAMFAFGIYFFIRELM